jgi:hypothetical protein
MSDTKVRFMTANARASIGFSLAVFISAGCGSSTLETGYKPRPLNASDAERRAYYSGRYTKEAVRAEQEREAQFRARRPGL